MRAPPRIFTGRTGWAAVLFIVSMLALIAGANWWIYNRIEEALDENLGSRLKSVVRTLLATNTIQGDALLSEVGRFDENELQFIDPVLKQIQDENELDAILLLDPVDYHVGYSSSDLYREGSQYPYLQTHVAAILEAMDQYAVTVSETIPVESLYLKSGFAPVVTLLGDEEVVGILVVEASADFFDVLGTVRGVMLSGGLVAAVLLLLLAATYLGLQRQIRRAQRALEREDRMAALGRLASQVAHEIRNPVGIIKYSAERMVKWLHGQGGGRRCLDPELVEMVNYIEEETGRLQDLTDRYLTYTRQGELRLQEVEPAVLLASTAQALERMDPPGGIELEVAVAEGLPVIQGDPDLLRQVLLNLCTNAIEAMGTAGRLTLFARVSPEDAVGDATGSDAGSAAGIPPGAEGGGSGDGPRMLLLGVEDTGPGIPDRLRSRIFEPFFSTREDGSGLGLYIVEGIVRSHGGEVKVEAVDGGGTRFILQMPVST